MENENEALVAVIQTAAEALDTEAVVGLLVALTEERERNHRLAAKLAEERYCFMRLVAAIDAERADYQRFRNLAGEEANAAREINAAAIEERDFWKQRANELSDRMTADVQPLLVGDPLAVTARVYRDAKGEPTSRKITAIKALRSYTGLGLREAKLAVEQVIKIVEMKEATD